MTRIRAAWAEASGAERAWLVGLPALIVAAAVVLAPLPAVELVVALWVCLGVALLAYVLDTRAWWVAAQRRVRPRPLLPQDPAQAATVDVVCHAAQRPHRWRWTPGVGWQEIDHPDGRCVL